MTDADVWEINANESVAYQYSRYNYNATQFFDRSDPFAASDHNPEIVGITAPEGTQTEINLLNINDFHGRIDTNTTSVRDHGRAAPPGGRRGQHAVPLRG